MTPTLLGRWQSRLYLMSVFGGLVSIIFAFIFDDFTTPFAVLAYVIVFGFGWDILYTFLQSFRWDRDWPPFFVFLAGAWEAAFFWWLFQTADKLPGVDPGLNLQMFLAHYGSVWLVVFIITFSFMRVFSLRWRYGGGRIQSSPQQTVLMILGAVALFGYLAADDLINPGTDFIVTVENISYPQTIRFNSGAFNTPAGTTQPGPIFPDDAYEFTFRAFPGDRLSFVSMLGESNDLFIGTDGIDLYNSEGAPVRGNITGLVNLWDAGTEVNEELGVGVNQAPRQRAPNTGRDENGVVQPVYAVQDRFEYPAVQELVRVTIVPDNGAFTVRIDNISNQGTFQSPFSPGVWVVHQDESPLFTSGEPDFGLGLENLAEEGDPSNLARAVRQEIPSVGVFNIPQTLGVPASAFPGEAYTFRFPATPGDHLSFATMLVQSNDLFIGTSSLDLFPENTPLQGEITDLLNLYDAGTEVNEEPGIGVNQAPRQADINTGADEAEPVRRIGDVEDGFEYPPVNDLIRATIHYDDGFFTIRVENVSNSSALPSPIAPGAFAVHRNPGAMFSAGSRDSGTGLEALAEDGSPVMLVDSLRADVGIASVGVFNTPRYAAAPAPIFPGETYEFSFTAHPGDSLSFASMLVQSNDLFIAPDEMGIMLFDENGAPQTGDITDLIALWDAGTEVNETPGEGENQAPRQSASNTGEDENSTVEVITAGYPAVEQLVRVTLHHSQGVFTIHIDNISDSSRLPTPFAPGVWLVHRNNAPYFVTGEADRGEGLEALAEDGDPGRLARTLSNQIHVVSAGGFNTPVKLANPAPIFPGEVYEFTVRAEPGDRLSFASMLVQSNDLFIAPDDAGIPLYDENNLPLRGDITNLIALWDAGTEVNETPGEGATQAPRQAGANIGADENGVIGLVREGYPPVNELVQVTIEPGEGGFTVRIINISGESSLPTPFAPGVWIVHQHPGALFTAGLPDGGLGLEALAEDGDPAGLEATLRGLRIGSPIAPGVWIVHTSEDPLFMVGEPDRGEGLEGLAEDGDAAPLADALRDNAGVRDAGVFAIPLGSSAPGPAHPGGIYQFEIRAREGDRLTLATMFVQSNDLFIAPEGGGIALFDEDGDPISGGVSLLVQLWDAGTEVNEQPGAGANQAPRQPAPNTGRDENGNVVLVTELNDGYGYPAAYRIVRVSIQPQD